MFTGLITDVGSVRAITRGDGDTRLEIATAFDVETIEIGASICCSGVCLTAIELQPGWFAVEASAETLDRTTIGRWVEGTAVNLERSLRLGDELGGHFVFGHVDSVGAVAAVTPDGDSQRWRFSADPQLLRFVAEKGSIAVDGVSLTVNDVDDAGFGVNLIPHTQSHTAFRDKQAGDAVNLEIDMLARYVGRMMETGRPGAG